MIKERIIYPELVNHLKRKEFTIITGARQTGKTTLLKELFRHLEKQGKKVWYISFEKEDLLRMINENPENIFKVTRRPANPLFEDQSEPYYFLIDEIQYAANPSNFLKYLYDTYSPHLKIVATGSSSFYLDKKFKDSLAGRKRIFILRTLSFQEYLIFNDKARLLEELKQIIDTPDYQSLYFSEMKDLFEDYLKFGGYPEVVLADDRREKLLLLEEIKNAYIKRDILESKVGNETKFYQLMQVLAMQTGNLLNKYELSKSLKLDLKTLDKYILVLQKCFHISLIKPFHANLKKELLKMPKVYYNDLGLRNLLSGNFQDFPVRADKGQLLENYVFIRLLEKYTEEEIKFWRTADQKEVDFVIHPAFESSFALEVKFSAANLKKKKYQKFIHTYPEIPLKFILYNTEGKDEDVLDILKL